MRQLATIVTTIFIFSMACRGQGYYEASGQTAVFTLAAGVKSGPAAIKKGPDVHAVLNGGIKVTSSRGSIAVIMPFVHQRSADIALYDIKGRQIYRQQGLSGTTIRLETRTLAAGVYSIIVRSNGQSYTRRVAVSGRGQ